MQEFLRDQEIGASTMCTLTNYFRLIKMRASGALKTNARFMREFVLGHPSYAGDSRVTDEIAYDLMREVDNVTKGGQPSDPDLLGGLNLLKQESNVA